MDLVMSAAQTKEVIRSQPYHKGWQQVH